MQHFIDETNIVVRSGNGGAGCVSFRRERGVPYGGPDGGDGGKGGDVVFITKLNVRTLYKLKLTRNFFAKNGEHGKGQAKHGKDGENIIIEVPPGTLIYDSITNELIKDLSENNIEYTLLKGGLGGRGNIHFATSTNQTPQYAQPGISGKELCLRLELKLIADVGLVGFPNVGKSTLLSVVSKAKPKIANYPFTTLIPNLGVFTVDEDHFVMADIPGIIEGASQGVGLGLDFLKHIERTKILLYLIDISDENYLEQYSLLKNELSLYSKNLIKKPSIIVVSKMDSENSNKRFENLKEKLSKNIVGISSITNFNIKHLLYLLKDLIEKSEKSVKN